METVLNNIRIVLVEPSHPGNIGAVARAMKNMGLFRLYLVKPKKFPAKEATERASGADSLLIQAVVVETLEEAIEDCHKVYGTSARSRGLEWPVMGPKQAAVESCSLAVDRQVAFVFGRENSGLKNPELERCNTHVMIPAEEDFSSLNLASAVQIQAYELKLALATTKLQQVGQEHIPVSSQNMERFFVHLEETLGDIQFLNPTQPRKLMARLRRLFQRANPDDTEMTILRGILSAVQKKKPQ